MLQTKRNRLWLMPWLTPILAGAAYLAALWLEMRQAPPVGPAELLVLFALAAPLVVAASVLLAIAEQELRAHRLTPRLQRWLLWTPRVLVFLFVVFLAMFSVDVFVEGRSAQEIGLALLMHNLPALALLAAGLLAWRWPLAGALGLTAFVVWWLPMTLGHRFFLSVFLLLAVLPLAGAALFWLNWMLHIPTRRTT
jgi:hypothetical protein